MLTTLSSSKIQPSRVCRTRLRVKQLKCRNFIKYKKDEEKTKVLLFHSTVGRGNDEQLFSSNFKYQQSTEL
jgi:hypothetical protein